MCRVKPTALSPQYESGGVATSDLLTTPSKPFVAVTRLVLRWGCGNKEKTDLLVAMAIVTRSQKVTGGLTLNDIQSF